MMMMMMMMMIIIIIIIIDTDALIRHFEKNLRMDIK
jgi:hypothetical protein